MTEVGFAVLLLAHPAAALLALLVPLLWRRGGPRSGARMAYAAAVTLLGIWVVAGYQAGVRADEQHTGGSVFDTTGWLLLAVAAAVLSVVLSRPRRRVA